MMQETTQSQVVEVEDAPGQEPITPVWRGVLVRAGVVAVSLVIMVCALYYYQHWNEHMSDPGHDDDELNSAIYTIWKPEVAVLALISGLVVGRLITARRAAEKAITADPSLESNVPSGLTPRQPSAPETAIGIGPTLIHDADTLHRNGITGYTRATLEPFAARPQAVEPLQLSIPTAPLPCLSTRVFLCHKGGQSFLRECPVDAQGMPVIQRAG